MQAIYYPGFTIGGAAAPLAIITLAAWLFIVATGSDASWLGGLALGAAIGTQVWTVVQPVNRKLAEIQAIRTSWEALRRNGREQFRNSGLDAAA